MGICYLCGKELSGDIDRDHIPAKQFFPESLREYTDNLLTMPVHSSCNKKYQQDEDYFFYSLGSIASKTPAGKELHKYMRKRLKRPNEKALALMVLKEFYLKPGGIALPYNTVSKGFDKKRVWRIAWKIVRGLFFHEKGKFVAEESLFGCEMDDNKSPISDLLYTMNLINSKGRYPGIFDFKSCFPYDPESKITMNFYLIRFWQLITMLIYFHDPECACIECSDRTFLHQKTQ